MLSTAVLTDSQKKFLISYEKPFINSITNTSPKKQQPAKIKIPMRNHQLAMIAAMEQVEQRLTNGWEHDSTKTIYGKYAFLGDNVGVGKSLMVLGHIASAMPILYKHSLSKSSNNSLFEVTVSPSKKSNSLIIVPHTIYKQWMSYITTQTDLTYIGISSIKHMTGDHQTLKETLQSVDVILITNTMLQLLAQYSLHFDRIFIDEADSIHIINGTLAFEYNFLWFITATWSNLILRNTYFYTSELKNYANTNIHPEFKHYLSSIIQNSSSYVKMDGIIRSQYLTNFYNMNSPINFNLILRSSTEFIKQSTGMPNANVQIYRCRGTLTQKIVGQFITDEVNALLHAGDIKGAFETLGVQTETPISFIEAVKLSKQNDLEKLHTELTLVNNYEYSTDYSKLQAINRVQSKINSLQDQLKAFLERLENKEEPCGICYDTPHHPAVTPCCSRIFCTKCIFESLKRYKGCPMCRFEPFNIKLVHYLSDEVNSFQAVPTTEKLSKKEDVLMKILLDNPDGKFLIFSRYDNPFATLENTIHKEGITVAQLKGTKNTISSRIKKFSEGNLKVLLLNNQYSGSGLNIIATTHIILWHAMSAEEEKQIVGRALRLGRTEDVTVIKLLHEDE